MKKVLKLFLSINIADNLSMVGIKVGLYSPMSKPSFFNDSENSLAQA